MPAFPRCVRNALPKFEKLSLVSGYIVRTYCGPGAVYLSNQKMRTCLNSLHDADLRLAGDSRPLHGHDGHCGRHNNGFPSIDEMQSAHIRQTTIFGEDDRKKVDFDDDEVYSVGSTECYLASGKIRRGSAAVVKEKGEEEGDVILTAEHILRDTETGVERVKCLFRPGNNRYVGIPIDMEKVVYGGKFYTKNEGDDWAVAGLTSTLVVTQNGKTTEVKKKNHLGYSPIPLIGAPNSGMTRDEPLAGRSIELYGYNGDTGGMSVSDNCTIHAKRPYDMFYYNDRVNIHDCDCIGGCSGGVLTTVNSRGRRVIVGILDGDHIHVGLDWTARKKFDSRWNVNTAVVINERILQAIESF